MKILIVTLTSLLFFELLSIAAFGQATIVATTGDWARPGTWTPGRLPGNNDIIQIPIGVTVTVRGTDHVLNNATLVVQGTLIMETTCFFCSNYGSLTFTGSNSSVVIEAGSSVFDGSLFGGDSHFISVDGLTIWSGGDCTSNCGIIEGNFNPPTEVGFPLSYNNPLPIELISFNTQLSGNVVEIEWATATEMNNDFFTIERSIDGLEWTIIGELEGAGDSHVRLDYQFIDHNPMPGMTYYRLKQTDFDGQFEYFDPAVLLYEPDNLFKVFPNPVRDILSLATSSNLEDAVIVIKNLGGQQEPVTPIVNRHQAEMDVSGLPPGVYVLEIVFPESTITKRILKK